MTESGKVGIVASHSFGFDLFNRKKLNWAKLEISVKDEKITKMEQEIRDLKESLSANEKFECKATKWFRCEMFDANISLKRPFPCHLLQKLVSCCELLNGKDIRFVDVNTTGTSVRVYYKDVEY